MPLTFDSIVSRNPGVMSAPLDSDLIVLNPERDNYIGLDPIGRRVWELLSEPATIKDLSGRLVQEYVGDAEEMTRDLMAFLTELGVEGLICAAEARDS